MKGLSRKPHSIGAGPGIWFYEEPDGLHVLVQGWNLPPHPEVVQFKFSRRYLEGYVRRLPFRVKTIKRGAGAKKGKK